MGIMKNASAPSTAKRSKDNERPLVEDIRLLGRILGDEIRDQDGVAAFDLIEKIRTLSVAFRRDADQEADKALKKLLKGLSGDQTVSVIRAFTYFSHLANLAEDRHHIRRRALHERAGDTANARALYRELMQAFPASSFVERVPAKWRGR